MAEERFIEVNVGTDVSPDWKVIDTFSDYKITYNSQYFSKKPSELKAPISDSFEIPLTDRNKDLFGISTVAPDKVPDLKARVATSSEVLVEGVLRVDSFRWNGLNNLISVQFEDKVTKSIRDMKKLNMSEFITDSENTTYPSAGANGGYRHFMWEGTVLYTGTINFLNTASNKIKYAYQDTINSGSSRVMYPFKADYNFDEKTGTQGLQPMYNVKNIMESAFKRVGLSIDGDFFNDLTTMNTQSEVYPASDLWVSLPAYWIAKTSDIVSGNAFTGHSPADESYGPTMGDRRTFSHSFKPSYPSGMRLIFGRGSWTIVSPSSGIARRWLYASHLTPLPKNPKSSVFQAYNVLDGYISGVDDPRPVMVFNRPARYKVNVTGFPTMPPMNIKVEKFTNGSLSSSPKLSLSDGVTNYNMSFYWSMILRKPNGDEKEFRVSNNISATANQVNGWLEIPSTPLSFTFARGDDKFIDANTGDQIEAFLMLKASEEGRVVIDDAQTLAPMPIIKNGGDMNDNVGENYFFTYLTQGASAITGTLDIAFSPFEETVPVTTGEVVNVKESLKTAYPETTLWDLVSMVCERFNLQLSYDLKNDVVYIDPVYRNRWLKSQQNGSQIPFEYKWDSSKSLEADVRKESLSLITMKNKSYNAVADKDSATGEIVASVIKKEVDPDGDVDYSATLKSGVFTGSVFGGGDDEVRKSAPAIPDNVLGAGQSPVKELKVNEYGIRFGFRGLNTNNIPATIGATMRWPLGLEYEGQFQEHSGRASYISLGSDAALWDVNHLRYYFDQGDIDYTVSCGLGDGNNTAFQLFYEDHISTIHNKTLIKTSFILSLEDLNDIPFGSVVDFGLGDFGIMSISGLALTDDYSEVTIDGYLL